MIGRSDQAGQARLDGLNRFTWVAFCVVVHVVILVTLVAKTGLNRLVRFPTCLKSLDIDLGGRDRLDFGTVRPPGSNPGPPTNF